MPATIDLHMHTVYSDGVAEPEALLEAVAAAGVKTLAVTDHDTTAAYERLLPKAQELGLELIPGIEINTHWEREDGGVSEVHVLGYYIDFEHPLLQAVCQRHRSARLIQIKAMVDKLWSVAKVKLDWKGVLGRSHPNGSLGRPHIAQALVEQKRVKTLSDAFNKYLKASHATYVKRPTATPHEAVEAIYESGGIPVIAHPGLCEQVEALVPELLPYGLMGLEAFHKSHNPSVVTTMRHLADQYDLLVTGGTDFHGQPSAYANAHHRLFVPPVVQERLFAARDKRRQAQVKLS